MADFALWATACETTLWPAGTFWSAYSGNRDQAVEGVIDADPVVMGTTIVITTTPSQPAPENAGTQASASSAPCATAPNSNHANGLDAPHPRTVASDADGPADGSSRDGIPTVRANPLNSADGTAADGADANLPSQSAPKKPEAPGWSARL
jgi:hypothetical protein